MLNGAIKELRRLCVSPPILSCRQFDKELKKLFGKDSSMRKSYEEWLYRQYEFMASRTLTEILRSKNFKPIVTPQGTQLYSIRKPKTPGNPRVLFYVFYSNDTVCFLFLSVFCEKDKSDYDLNIGTALSRLGRYF